MTIAFISGAFLIGLFMGGLVVYLLYYRKYSQVRRIRFTKKLKNLQETGRLEGEGF